MNSISSSSFTVQAKSLLQVQEGGPLTLLSNPVFSPMSENRKQESLKKIKSETLSAAKKNYLKILVILIGPCPGLALIVVLNLRLRLFQDLKILNQTWQSCWHSWKVSMGSWISIGELKPQVEFTFVSSDFVDL